MYVYPIMMRMAWPAMEARTGILINDPSGRWGDSFRAGPVQDIVQLRGRMVIKSTHTYWLPAKLDPLNIKVTTAMNSASA